MPHCASDQKGEPGDDGEETDVAKRSAFHTPMRIAAPAACASWARRTA